MTRNESIVTCLHQIRSTDEYTYNHCINTAFYSMLIAKWLELPEDRVKKAIQAGMLHDIGKSKIPADILNKKGYLTTEDFEIIKRHPVFGYDLINEIKEADIGLYARIVSIADVYDAMTSERTNRSYSAARYPKSDCCRPFHVH